MLDRQGLQRNRGAMPDSEGHPDVDDMDLGAILTALADPHRRKVVITLTLAEPGAERPCGVFGLPVAKSTRTHHFRVLREAGLTRQVDHGNGSTVSLRRGEVEARFPGLLGLIAAEGGF